MGEEKAASQEAGPSTGILVVVLGASGVGKDTLLARAADALGSNDDVHFVRRAITRPAHDASEAFRPMTDAEFDRALDDGEFCFTWSANGLRYGLPRSMSEHVATGGLAVVNGSRAAFPHMLSVFGAVRAVEVTASPEVLAARLAARGRETRDEIAARLERTAMLTNEFEPALVIENSGAADAAAAVLIDYLRECRKPAATRESARIT